MDKQILPSDTKGQIFNLTVSHAVNRDTIASAMAATPSSVLALEIKRLNRVIVKTNNLKKNGGTLPEHVKNGFHSLWKNRKY